MKTRWKEMNYNEELDCWVVFWGDNSGYKMRCGEWFDLHLGNDYSHGIVPLLTSFWSTSAIKLIHRCHREVHLKSAGGKRWTFLTRKPLALDIRAKASIIV